ncbi:MAG TPA: hypothetical protein VF682_19705 [Pseudomonas sp.]
MLIDNNLVSFTPDIGSLERADIQDCLLYAHIAAQSHNREQNWVEWVDTFQQTLDECGFIRQNAIDRRSAKFKKREQFQKEASDLIRQVTSPQLAQTAESSLDTMFNSGHAKTFFSSWFSAGRSDSMQIIPCQLSSPGRVSVVVCGLQMTTRTLPKAWWQLFSVLPQWPLDYEMTLLLKGSHFSFDATRYAPHRKSVQKELVARSVDKIRQVSL